MYKGKFYILLMLSLAAISAQAGSLNVENRVRVGYDDNVFATDDSGDAVESATVVDIVTLTGKMNFSTRTDFMVYYEPQFWYRADADPDFVSYHNLYAELNHAISRVVSLTVADRLRYNDKQGQSDLVGGQGRDQSYLENDLQGAADVVVSSKSSVKLSAGYLMRVWDDADYGETNDYTTARGDIMYQRELRPATTYGFVGGSYTDQAYDSDTRGGYNGLNAYAGLGHSFTPNVNGNLQLGYTFAEVETVSETSDSDTPFLSLGIDYSPSARTLLTVSGGYSLAASENSLYNAQERMNATLGFKHDLTAKISLSASVSYILSLYNADSATYAGAVDAEDTLISANIRASYQVNRNNFLEIGYDYTKRDVDVNSQGYDRNRADIGWRLVL